MLKLKSKTDTATRPPNTPDDFQISLVGGHLRILGVHRSVEGSHSLYVVPAVSEGSPALPIPFHLLGESSGGRLKELLLNHGYLSLLKVCSIKEVSSWLLQEAEQCRTLVLDRLGTQVIEVRGFTAKALVKGGQCHFIGPKPDGLSVRLVGAAAAKSASTRTLSDFNRILAPVIASNPRVLVVLCIALASLFLRLYGRSPLGLAVIGMSSRGKSIVQRLVMYLVGGPTRLETMNATAVGLHDHLAAFPDQPVFMDDAHGADAAQALLRAIMDSGNNARRLRSTAWAQAKSVSEVSATLIVSAERGLADTARSARQPLNAGVLARIFELHLGTYGMFDDLCGRPDARSLALELKAVAPDYHGVLGDALAAAVAEQWERVMSMHGRHFVSVQEAIRQRAGAGALDGVNERVLDGLTFAAFIGCSAVQLGLIDIKKSAITGAFGLVFGEYLGRQKQSATPTGAAVIEAVRHYLQTNPARFPPLSQAGDPTKVNGLSGYLKSSNDGQHVYLFFPGTFRQEFEEEFGPEVYSSLRDAGFLRCQKSRHNTYSARVPGPRDGPQRRQNFVAVSEAILYEAAEE